MHVACSFGNAQHFGLPRYTDFTQITSDTDIAEKLRDLYDNDIDRVDAYVAGLAEGMFLLPRGGTQCPAP